MILFADAGKRRMLHLVWAGMFPLLVMSGERKALIIYLILTALLFARGRVALIVPAVATAFVGLLLLSTVVENPYLQRQIQTLVEPGGTGNYEYVIATGQYLPGDTPSDVQRAFALHVSEQMFAAHPFFGVGTNQYLEIVDQTYPNVPSDLRLEIHGEFQRILTENGLFGFSLYMLIWVAAWVRLSGVLRDAAARGLLTGTQVTSAAASPLHPHRALRRHGGLGLTCVHRRDRHLAPAGTRRRRARAGRPAACASPIRPVAHQRLPALPLAGGAS